MARPLPKASGLAARQKRTVLGARDASRVDSTGRVKFDWADFSQKLPSGRDDASEARRRTLFSSIDANGNGVLSLAEFDRGLLEVLGADYSQRKTIQTRLQLDHYKPDPSQ